MRLAALSLYVAITSAWLSSRAHAQCLDFADGFGTPGNAMAFPSGGSPEVWSLAEFDDGTGPAVFAAGRFSVAGTTVVNRLAKWNGTGWDAVATPTNFTPERLYVTDLGDGSALYVSGKDALSTQGASRIARYDGSSWTFLGGSFQHIDLSSTTIHSMKSLTQSGQTSLYAAGSFSLVDGVNANFIAEWDGAAWSAVHSTGTNFSTGYTVTYDNARQRAVRFGISQHGTYQPTYEWDGQGWSLVGTTGPNFSGHPNLLYDPVGQRVLTVGSGSAGTRSVDVQQWTGSTWTQIGGFLPTSSNRVAHSTVVDPVRNKLVLFGGRVGNSTYLGDTWEFDFASSTWSLVASSGPAIRAESGMTWDPTRQKIVLFGGRNNSVNFNDFWEWNGTSWTLIGASYANVPESGAQLGYDHARSKLVLFINANGILNNTFEWNGSGWTLLFNSSVSNPNTSLSQRMYYDSREGALVICADNNSMWKWTGSTWQYMAGGFNGQINALEVFDAGSGPRLYAGGNFLSTGPLHAVRVAALDPTGWSQLTTTAGPNARVDQLYVTSIGGPALVASGDFVSISRPSQSALQVQHIARWTPSTAWAAFGSGLTGSTVASVVQADLGAGQRLYASGNISNAGATPLQNLAQWDGTSWSAVGGGLSGGYAASMLPVGTGSNARLWLGGNFTSAGGKQSIAIGRWGEPCSAPIPLDHPQDTTPRIGAPLTLYVTAQGVAPLTFQWRRNGVDLIDIKDKVVGSQTSILTIHAWSRNDAGEYDCVITNSLGSSTTNAGLVTITGAVPGLPVAYDNILIPSIARNTDPQTWYTSFEQPVPLNNGDVLLRAKTSSTQTVGSGGDGVTLLESDDLTNILSTNEPAPGYPGLTTSLGVYCMSITEDRRMVLASDLQGPGVTSFNRAVAWYRDAKGFMPLGRATEQAPSLPANWNFVNSPFRRVQFFNDSVVLSSALSNGEYAAWTWSPDSGFSLIGKTTDPAPGTASTFTRNFDVKYNDAGVATLSSELNVFGFPDGLWSGPLGAFSLIALVETPPPALPGNWLLKEIRSPILADDGSFAFAIRSETATAASVESILTKRPGQAVELIVSQNDPSPGGEPGATIQSPVLFHATPQGVVIGARIQDGCGIGCFYDALYVVNNKKWTTIARTGDPVPGFDSSHYFKQFVQVSPGPNGDMLILALIGVQGTTYNAAGSFGYRPDIGLFPCIVPGTQIEITPGQFRTVVSAELTSDPNGTAGRAAQSIADSGVLAVQATINIDRITTQRGVFIGRFAKFLRGFAPCPGDANDDRLVNAADLSVLLAQFGNSVEAGLGADLNSDGVVNAADLSVLLGTFNSSCN